MEWEPCVGSIVASGLHTLGYPIEIGWSSPQGAPLSFLVQPKPDWRYWDPKAEAQHHLVYADLEQYGRTPLEIAVVMNAQLAGQMLYFDGNPYHRHWLQQLFSAAHEKPTFEIADFDVLLACVGCLSAKQRESAEKKVRNFYCNLTKYRATENVRFLQILFRQAVYELTDDEILRRALKIAESRFVRLSDPLSDPKASRDFLRLRIGSLTREVFCCVYLDNRHRVIAFEELFHGTLDGASVHPREVVVAALQLNAAAVIFAHNHPSGVAEPSEADRRLTQRLKDALALVDVRVLDHFVVGAGEVVSFAERGIL